MTIPPDTRDRLVKLLGMMGSAHDGEILNAARLAVKLLKEHKATWTEVFAGGDDFESRKLIYDAAFKDGYKRGLAEGSAKSRSKPLTWRALAKLLLEDYEADLTPWECTFVQSFLERGYPNPTPKQTKIFERIDERVECGLPDGFRPL